MPKKITTKNPKKISTKKTPKKKSGRPPKTHKIDSSIVQKITEVLKVDGTIEEACGYAKISTSTHYNWIRDKLYFLDKIEVRKEDGTIKTKLVDRLYEDAVNEAQQYPYIFAKKTLFKSITGGSPAMAMEFLKRRDPRYKDKLSINPNRDEPLTKEEQDKIDLLMSENNEEE